MWESLRYHKYNFNVQARFTFSKYLLSFDFIPAGQHIWRIGNILKPAALYGIRFSLVLDKFF
jgi:hypothetical protein